MQGIGYREIPSIHYSFFVVLGIMFALILAGLYAAWYMEHHGHWVTGMDNQIVWGVPHVFAIFLILSASGALNIASIATVFGRASFKPLSRFSALVAIALLIGGLSVLVLDLGRPDRLLIAMTHYNFRSVFAWNIFLYVGFLILVGFYVWSIMDRKMEALRIFAGATSFLWRLVLTSATGLIFGFLIARESYDSAILAPMFIAMSLSFGLAVFYLFLQGSFFVSRRKIGNYIVVRLGKLLRIFVSVVLYIVVISHLTNLYASEHQDIERFFLLSGREITVIFWIGQILIGSFLPLLLLFPIDKPLDTVRMTYASVFVVIGGISQLYVIIIGGQAYPLILFPGYEVSSSFFDGVINVYTPSLIETLLGIGGVALAVKIVFLGSKILPFLPTNLDDKNTDPHYESS
ncbi:MAG: molybdopterin oxidoreductase [Magnetovibrio sp.]|nr:molybdopterin oxidoreductase [Magnetovibrio sp.]